MDYEFIIKFSPMFYKAGILTIKLAIYGILLSIVVGFICTYIRFKKIPFLSPVITAYIELSRNTPLLIQLFFLYYALPKIGISLSSMSCAVIGLAFLGGSYMSESFRLGFESVKKSQIEAGMSLAMTHNQVLKFVILPKALSISMPSISANIIFLLKETSIVSIVALGDLVYAAKDIMGIYYKTNEALLMLSVSYLIIILPLSLGLTYLEKRLDYAR